MNGQGHFVRMKKPSKPELYEDASRILEEFLRKQVNDARSAHGHPSRFKTHPMSSFRPLTSAEVIDERAEPSLPENIDRSYTMPTRARDESGTAGVRLKVNKLDMLMERVTQKPAADTDNGALSADTEGDSEHNLLHRKKKGFLQKAVDRLLYVMHRQERERECSVTVDKKGSLRNGHKKHHVNSITTELQKPTIDMHAKTDKSGSSVDTRKESYASQFGLRGRRSSSVGKAFFSSLRKSFRPRKGSNKHDNVSGDVGEHVTGSLLGPESSSSQSMPPDQDCLTLQSRFGLMVGDDMTNGGHGGGGRGGGAQHVVKVNNRSSWSFSTKAGGGSQSPCPHSNSTDFGDRSNSMFSFASSKGKNPLDHPDDDIQYMDIDGAELGIRFVSCPVPMHGVDVPDNATVEVEMADVNLPLHLRASMEKKEMYGKIVQKLIQIADTYNGESRVSDGENSVADSGMEIPLITDQLALSDLEHQIMECLRDIGDRNSQTMSEVTEKIVCGATSDTYDRFKTTVQHSLGNEVSWNSLAMLFYTTKGVVTAVGMGTQLASAAKEMTLRYFSDKFAGWLMDRGGFDGVLTESESDHD